MSIIEKCNRCGRRLDWNSLYFAYDECGCVAIPSPKDQPKAPLVTPLPQVLTVANMTLHDWYIGQALAGILAHQGLTGNPELQAQNACDMANLVMQAREEKP